MGGSGLNGMTEVIHLQEDADWAVLRACLRQARDRRIVLALPWEARFLSQPLEGDLVRREAERLGLEVAVVSRDPERRTMLRGAGLPVFGSVERAQAATTWPRPELPPVEPPRRAWWEEEIPLVPPVRVLPPWVRHVRIGGRLFFFLATVLFLLAAAYIVVPQATVTLVPAGTTVRIITPVSVVLSDEEIVDTATGTVSARRVGDYFEGYIEVETTGTAPYQSGWATGNVLFTNLLGQDVMVPVGTVVRTSAGSFPVRFVTTQPVAVPALGQAAAPVQAVDEGPAGNVGVNQINQIEGFLAFSLRVTNPEPTYGGAVEEVRAASQADRDRARELLTERLLDEAYQALQQEYYLEPTEFLIRQSLQIQASELTYNRFLNERADALGLQMRILVTGLAVDQTNVKAVAYARLADSIPPGHYLRDSAFSIGEVAEEPMEEDVLLLFVTATGYAVSEVDGTAVRQEILGLPLPQAMERLEELGLAAPPAVQIWPRWFKRLPVLPLRIEVEIAPLPWEMVEG